MRRSCGHRVLAVVAVLAGGACSAIPTGHNQAVRELDREAATIAKRIERSRLRLNDDGHPETTASGLAQVVSGSDDDPPVLEAKGDVFHGGADLVVRLRLETTGFADANETVVRCYRFRVTEAWFHVEYTSTSCPSGSAGR